MQKNAELIRQLISCIDLTLLDENAAEQDVMLIANAAKEHQTAAVCVYPKHLPIVRDILRKSSVQLATVANFPEGNRAIDVVLRDIENSIAIGAHEIDVVIPFADCIKGRLESTATLVSAARSICGDRILLKTIIESGALLDPMIMEHVTETVIESGTDFVKTSTGKWNIGATVDAAEIILSTIAKQSRPVGFKVSGGVANFDHAFTYYQMTCSAFQKPFLSPNEFRIGASKLLKELIEWKP